MRLLLTVNPALFRSGYTNICPIAGDGGVLSTFENLDNFCARGEAKEVIVHEGLEYIGANHINTTMTNWFEKIAYGGTLTIIGTDIRRVAHALINQSFDLDGLNRFIYGNQRNQYEFKKCCMNMNDVALAMSKYGFTITTNRIEGLEFVITGRRSV